MRTTMLTTAGLLVAFVCGSANSAFGQGVRSKTIMRVFWQDRESQKLSYADLKTTNRWNLKRGWVSGFPQIDPAKQSLGAMTASRGKVFVAIDSSDKDTAGGWILLDSGAYEKPHGNHTHWKYTRRPSAALLSMGAGRGADSVIMEMDEKVYLADGSGDQITQFVPGQIRTGSQQGIRNLSKIAGSVVLAASAQYAFAAHQANGESSVLQVELTDLGSASLNPVRTFRLPMKSVSGAIANSGKLFFAHEDGISWVEIDQVAVESGATVAAKSLSLTSNSAPFRVTGRFRSQRNWVVCSTGQGADARMCFINAATAAPEILTLAMPIAEGLTLTAPEVRLSLGKRYAFVFHQRESAESNVQERLSIVLLDPDKDGNLSDAKVVKTIPVGASAVSGRHGRHGICFDAYGRHAIVTSPGNGVLTVLSLPKLTVMARFQVGGSPDGIVAVGAPEHFH